MNTLPQPNVNVTPPSVSVAAPVGPALGGAGLGSGRQAVPLRVPLPFLLSGVSGAALFGVLLPLVGPDALRALEYPHVLALVHIATLGWLTMTVMGASFQLVPVILVSPLHAARFIRWQYPVYAGGVAVLVLGFWTMRPWLIALGGSCVVVAVAHYVIVLGTTIARAPKRPLTARYLAASLVYLCCVVCLGLTAALNLQFGFLGAGGERLLRVHLVLGIVGWLTCTVIGVSYTLVRMFALVHGHDDRLGRRIFALLQAAILGAAAGFALSWTPLIVAGGILLLGAVWLFAYDYLWMLRLRRRRPLDVTLRHSIASIVYLACVTPATLLAVALHWTPQPLLATLGLMALVGWLGQSVLGYLYKIVPFLIWQARYGSLVGRQKVPLMRDMVQSQWAEASWWLFNVGLPVTALAALMSWTSVMRLGAACLGAGLVLATANIVRVARQ